MYTLYEIAKKSIELTNSKSKLRPLKKRSYAAYGYRPFNISLLKKKFKNLEIYKLKEGLKDYLKVGVAKVEITDLKLRYQDEKRNFKSCS